MEIVHCMVYNYTGTHTKTQPHRHKEIHSRPIELVLLAAPAFLLCPRKFYELNACFHSIHIAFGRIDFYRQIFIYLPNVNVNIEKSNETIIDRKEVLNDIFD